MNNAYQIDMLLAMQSMEYFKYDFPSVHEPKDIN